MKFKSLQFTSIGGVDHANRFSTDQNIQGRDRPTFPTTRPRRPISAPVRTEAAIFHFLTIECVGCLSARRKSSRRVRGGHLTLDEACARYALSIEEFLAWQHGISLFGLAGLRVYREQGRERTKPSPEDVRSKVRLNRKAVRAPSNSG